MKVYSIKELLYVVIVMIVLGVIGYFIGLNMFFVHSAFEIFYYILFFAVGFLVYNLVAWIVETMLKKDDGDTETKVSGRKATT